MFQRFAEILAVFERSHGRPQFGLDVVELFGDGLVSIIVLFGGHPALDGFQALGQCGHALTRGFDRRLRHHVPPVVRTRCGPGQEHLAKFFSSLLPLDLLAECPQCEAEQSFGVDSVVMAFVACGSLIPASFIESPPTAGDAIHALAATVRLVEHTATDGILRRVFRTRHATLVAAPLVHLVLDVLKEFRRKLRLEADWLADDDLRTVEDHFGFAIRATVFIAEWPWPLRAETAMSPFGAPARVLNADDGRLRQSSATVF